MDILHKLFEDNCAVDSDVSNIIIVIVCTNYALSKAEMRKVAEISQGELACMTYPKLATGY
ncbi:hypothetical protein [Pantoea sp. DY-17]|uniref:hypothetical protein n=1 Tax=Pantoea sp. DY-17 TaxID=2871490 RepID=UPI001C94FFE7|nr:hypothetical protein [Pantoea sp. DY-17]MBY4954576.1 hypothetical protein [Pantoea sp. DY-17]